MSAGTEFLPRWHVKASYAGRNGAPRVWSGTVQAGDTAAAVEAAKARVRKRCASAAKFDVRVWA